MHDKVIFDDAILDARRWKARQFEATGMRQLEALARANELAADAAAIAAGGRDVTDISFGIVASYKKQGSRAIQIDKLVSVEISEFEISNVQNQKKNEVMLPILFMGLE